MAHPSALASLPMLEIYIDAADKLPKDGLLTAAEFLAAELQFNQTVFRKSLFDPSNGDINDGNQFAARPVKAVLVPCQRGR
jgi:hypothetical protein